MSIPVKVFKEAVAALNKVLPKGEKIKTLRAKKEDILAAFTDYVVKSISEGTAEDLPEVVVDMYNDHIAMDEGGEEAGADVEKESTKKTTKKTTKKKESGPKKLNKNTREVSIVTALTKGGTSEEVIKLADESYVSLGGSSNIAQSKKLFIRGIKYLEAAGILSVDGDKYILDI